MKINLNVIVQFKVTELGLKCLEKEYTKNIYSDETFIFVGITHIAHNTYELRLWEFMHVFGTQCFIGSEAFVHENSIDIKL